MTRLAPTFARGLAAALLLAGSSQTLACTKITTVALEEPIQIQAQPPAPPLADLPAVPQPAPPPPRVTLDGDLVRLDEALTFDAEGKLASEHQDILAELGKWLAEHPEVVELTVEVQSGGEGSRRTQQKRSKAMATQIVDALVGQGVAAERLVAGGLGKSDDEQIHVTLRISKRAAQSEAVVPVEGEG